MVLDSAFSTGHLPRSEIPSLPPSDACLSNKIRSEPHQASACLRPHCIICIRNMHIMHILDFPACIICIRGMHNMHTGVTRRACRARPGRQIPSHLLMDTEKLTSRAYNPKKTGGRLAAAPSHIQSGLAARLPVKSIPSRRRAGVLTVQSSRGMRRLPERAASISSVGGLRPER